MKQKIHIHSALTALIILISVSIYPQMPDWKFFRDRAGNTYYLDGAMKIRITDEKPFDYIPVSAEGSDYLLHKGIELIKGGGYPEGLFYLKSIKTLPAGNLRSEKNARAASDWINALKRKHGDRFERFDMESTLLLNVHNGIYSIINERLRYRLVITKRPEVTRALWKLKENGYGLKFGFNLDEKDGDKTPGYDCVLGIESRVFRGKLTNINEAEMSWRKEMGRDGFVRQEILRRDDRIIYSYNSGDNSPFSGLEGVYLNGNIVHILRVICPAGLREQVFEVIQKPVEDLVLVNKHGSSSI